MPSSSLLSGVTKGMEKFTNKDGYIAYKYKPHSTFSLKISFVNKETAKVKALGHFI